MFLQCKCQCSFCVEKKKYISECSFLDISLNVCLCRRCCFHCAGTAFGFHSFFAHYFMLLLLLLVFWLVCSGLAGRVWNALPIIIIVLSLFMRLCQFFYVNVQQIMYALWYPSRINAPATNTQSNIISYIHACQPACLHMQNKHAFAFCSYLICIERI